jgi:hypothetical protein
MRRERFSERFTGGAPWRIEEHFMQRAAWRLEERKRRAEWDAIVPVYWIFGG